MKDATTPKTELLQIRVRGDVKEWVQRQAELQDRSISNFVAWILTAAYEKAQDAAAHQDQDRSTM